MDGVRGIPTQPVFGTSGVGDVLLPDVRPGFKRVDLARGYQERPLTYGWMEFHDDGAFLGVVVGDDRFDPPMLMPDETPIPGFYDTRLTCEVVARLTAYGLLARHFGVYGELALRAGFSDHALPAALVTGPGRSEVIGAQTLDHAVSTALSLDATDLLSPRDVLTVAAPILDDLASAFAWPRGFQLDRDGTVRGRYWGGGWSGNVQRWASEHDVPSTGFD
jgi:hypothetical protein